MSRISRTVSIDDVVFELRPNVRNASKPDWVCLRKTPKSVECYQALAPRLQGCNMIEVGVDQGGATSFFTKLYNPTKFLALELSSEPVAKLVDFLAQHDTQQHVRLEWGVDQADTATVARLVDETFGETRLDLVVDDASHLLQPSTATFEELFPRLRQGGIYIIEDWSLDHQLERVVQEDSGENAEVARIWEHAASMENPKPLKPTSLLICQLVLAAARNPEWVSSITLFKGYCEVRRGVADIAAGEPIASYVGGLGQLLFSDERLAADFQ